MDSKTVERIAGCILILAAMAIIILTEVASPPGLSGGWVLGLVLGMVMFVIGGMLVSDSGG